MKSHSEFIADSFIDYEGKEHRFVICALSEELPTELSNYIDSKFDTCGFTVKEHKPSISWDIVSYIEDWGNDYYDSVTKALSFGIAICNPEDEFNLEVGKKAALNRAKNAMPKLFVTEKGLINSTMVQALLRQEAEYLKDNPSKYIKGYKDRFEKYKQNLKKQEICNNLTESEKEIARKLDDVNYLENLLTYNKVWKEQLSDL